MRSGSLRPNARRQSSAWPSQGANDGRKRGPTPPQAQPRRLSEEERELAAHKREIERALAEIQRRAAAARAPDTPPEVVAAILAEDFGEMPSPVGFTETLAEQSFERARAVAAEVWRLAPGSLVALTFTAEVARIVDGDLERSVALLEEAIDADGDSGAPGAMGMHLIGAGMSLEALETARECLDDDPGDDTGQTVLAAALGRLHDPGAGRRAAHRDGARGAGAVRRPGVALPAPGQHRGARRAAAGAAGAGGEHSP